MRFRKTAWIVGVISLLPMFGCSRVPKPEDLQEPPEVTADDEDAATRSARDKPAEKQDKEDKEEKD